MLEVGFTWFTTVYVALGMGFVLALWAYYDGQSVRAWKHQRRSAALLCAKCGTLYRAPVSKARGRPCPACGTRNDPMQF